MKYKKIKAILIVVVILLILLKGIMYTWYSLLNTNDIKFNEIILESNESEGNTFFVNISLNMEVDEEHIVQQNDNLVVYEKGDKRAIITRDGSSDQIEELIEQEPKFRNYFDEYNIDNDMKMILHYYYSDYRNYNILTPNYKLEEANLFNRILVPSCDYNRRKCDLYLLDGYLKGEAVISYNSLSIKFVHRDSFYAIYIREDKISYDEAIKIIKSIKLN